MKALIVTQLLTNIIIEYASGFHTKPGKFGKIKKTKKKQILKNYFSEIEWKPFKWSSPRKLENRNNHWKSLESQFQNRKVCSEKARIIENKR